MQYEFAGHRTQTLTGLPLLSLVLTAPYPSMQKHWFTLLALALDVLSSGHWLLIPVKHQFPCVHGWHWVSAVPLKPGLQ